MNRFFTIALLYVLTITISIGIYVSTVHAEDSAPKAENEQSAAPVKPEDEIIARVNDYTITYHYHQLAISSLMPRMAYHKVVSEERMNKIEKTALENLIMGQLLYEEALRRNLKTTRREVKKRVKEFHNSLPKGKTLGRILKQSNMTKKDLEEEFRRGILIEMVRAETDEEVSAKVKELVNDAFMKDYYDDNLKKFVEPEKTHLSEILLKADPGGGKRRWLEVREKAKGIEARVRGGEEFAVVAREVSQDSYAPNGGDMGWAHTGSLDPALQQAVNMLQPGEISGPVESLYGYHIIKLHERTDKELKPYDELNHKKLKARLDKAETERLQNEWMDSLKDKADIEYY